MSELMKWGVGRGEYTLCSDEHGNEWLWALCEVPGCPRQVCHKKSDRFCWPHLMTGGEVKAVEAEKAADSWLVEISDRIESAPDSAQASSAPLPPDDLERMKRLSQRTPKIKPLTKRGALDLDQ